MDWLSYCYVPQMGHTPVREGLIVQDNERARTTEGLASTDDSHYEYSGCHGIDGRVWVYGEKAFFDRYDSALYHIE